MIDVAVDRLSAWMEVEGRDRDDFKVVVTAAPTSPWLLVDFVWAIAYDAALPDRYRFAIAREIGAVHRLDENGAVEDHELFRIPV
jgi:hypothetical protein